MLAQNFTGNIEKHQANHHSTGDQDRICLIIYDSLFNSLEHSDTMECIVLVPPLWNIRTPHRDCVYDLYQEGQGI